MEITGRVTENAQVRTTKNSRELVAFTIVDNNHYKTKAGEKKNDPTFFNCAYWISTSIAPHLTKGAIVTLSGRVGVNAYKNKDGDYIAHLTFNANNIKIIAKGSATVTADAGTPETKDDLPF